MDLSRDAQHLANDALSLDFSNEAHDKRGLETLQSLHHLEDKVLPLSARLRSILGTVRTLKQHKDIFFPEENREQSINVADELRSYETQLQGHLASVELLEKRAQEILKLVRYRCLLYANFYLLLRNGVTDALIGLAKCHIESQEPSYSNKYQSKHPELDKGYCR